ncbi:hypothetical protein HPB50_022928 [Hyalomma asiaticum]|uniref:Uncharacterized protein n=1 Tax=Hyalomma asiaticum TaxID=266040 RepID=A0ACB7T2I3_HYAAI|nr:hypothetical protein HPB50_022928 [Hyalomma asiaticum]
MQRRSTDGSFYTPQSLRKSGGDFFYDESDSEVVDERHKRETRPRRRHDDRYGDRFEEATYGPRKLDQRFASRKLDRGEGVRRHNWSQKTETPYISYRAEVQENQKPISSPTKVVDAKDDKRYVDVRGAGAASGVVSESSYYGDTSVEALSMTAKTVSSPADPRRNEDTRKVERGPCRGDAAYGDTQGGSGGSQRAKNVAGVLSSSGERRNGSAPISHGTAAKGQNNGRKNSVQENELPTNGAASLQAKTVKREEGKGVAKRIDSPRTLGGVFGEELALDGLLPADASIDKLEKEAGLGYAAYKTTALPTGEEIIQASSQSSVVGLPAPGFFLRSSDEGRGKAAPTGKGKLNRAEARGLEVSAEDSFAEKRATEQQSRRRNGQKALPVVEEPVVVPAVATESMTSADYSQDKERHRGNRRQNSGCCHRREVPAEVHEGFDVTDDEIRHLLDSRRRNGSGRRTERTSEYKTASSGGPSSMPYSPSASGRKNSRGFVFKMQRVNSSGIDLSEEDYDRDATFRSCRTGGSAKLSSQRQVGSSSDKYASARREPEADVARNAPGYRSSKIDEHSEAEYSDADSEETLRAGEGYAEGAFEDDSDSQFTTVASKWTEGKSDPRTKLQAERTIGPTRGRFVQESARVERKFVSKPVERTEGEYLTPTCEDESPSGRSELQSWSVVSTEAGSSGDYDRRRLFDKFEDEEGTTSFSLASSCWCPTPTRASGSEAGVSGHSANGRLDSPLMGDFRSRSNIVLRRSHSSLHVSLRSLSPAVQIHADGPVLVVLGGINPEDPMREDLGGFSLDALEYDGPAPSAYCFCLDIERMSWRKCASMSQPRACHACAVVGQRIYVAGGKDSTGRITDTAEYFDVEAGRWERVPNLPRPLMASAATYFNSRIWVLGGITYSSADRCKVTSTVFEFDLQESRWFRSTSLWTPLAHSLALTTADSSGKQRLWLWGGMDENGRSVGELRLWRQDRRAWKSYCRLQRPRHAFCGAAIGDLMCVVGGTESPRRVATDANTRVDVANKEVYSACPLPYPLTGSSALVLPAHERPSSFHTVKPSDEESTDGSAYKMRTVYRRYRQRVKVKDEDDTPDSQFPAVGVYEATRILDSTFDSSRIRRQEISREKSPTHGTKEEYLALELRDNSRQRRKELEKKRESRYLEGTGCRQSYQIMAPSVDPNLGLALVLQDGDKTCSSPYSETAMVIDSIRRCKNITSAATWGVLSFGGIDLHRPSCHGTGGCDPGQTRCDEMVASDCVFCFSTANLSWTEKAKLPEARAFHGAAVLGDQVYVVGGRDQNGSYLDTVAVYSPMLNAWTVVLDLPVALMGAAVLAYEGRIWVLGGVAFDENAASVNNANERLLDDVFIVDTRNRRCFKGPSLPFPWAFAAGAVCDGQIWLCGGLTPFENGKLVSTSNIYVLDDGFWVFYDVLTLNRHAFPAANYADKFVMLFGGVSTSYEGSVDECEVFFAGPGHGNLRLRPPPFRLAGHACVVLPPGGGAAPNVRDIWRRMCEATQRT